MVEFGHKKPQRNNYAKNYLFHKIVCCVVGFALLRFIARGQDEVVDGVTFILECGQRGIAVICPVGNDFKVIPFGIKPTGESVREF
jgi:hypothetical protein